MPLSAILGCLAIAILVIGPICEEVGTPFVTFIAASLIGIDIFDHTSMGISNIFPSRLNLTSRGRAWDKMKMSETCLRHEDILGVSGKKGVKLKKAASPQKSSAAGLGLMK